MPPGCLEFDLFGTHLLVIHLLLRLLPTNALRFRAMILVLLATLPAIGLIAYSAYQNRQVGIEQVREDALRTAREAISRHRYWGDLRADPGWLRDTVETGNLPSRSLVVLVDRNGTIVSRYPEGADEAGGVGGTVPDLDGFLQLVARGGEGVSSAMAPMALDGVDRVFASVPLEHSLNARTYLRVGIPLDAAMMAANRALAIDLAAMAMAIVLVFEIVWFFSAVLVRRRTRALVEATCQPGASDVAALDQLARPAVPEFGPLALSFDQMARGLQRVTRAWRTLAAGNRALLHVEDETALLYEMCRVGVESGGYRLVWVGYAEDDAEKRVLPVAHAGEDKGFLRDIRVSWSNVAEGKGSVGAAIRNGGPQVLRNLATDPNFAPWREAAVARGYASACGLPLMLDGRAIGAIAFYAADTDAFDDKELELLGELADNLAFGIRNLRQRAAHSKAEATIRHFAYFDELTGLARRVLLTDSLRQCIVGAGDSKSPFALLMLEIGSFGDIRGVLGYHWGDRLLQEIARRLERVAQSGWLCARLQEERFAVLLPHLDAYGAIAAAHRVEAAFAAPFELAGIMVEVQASIGIALYPQHGVEADVLVQRAGLAASEGVRACAGITVYRGATAQENPQRLTLVAELRRAIEQDELILHYQPKVAAGSRQVTGVEALVRWQHPVHGLVPPGEFIALAEQTGLIKPLTYWVLRAALKQTAVWQEEGLEVAVAVNLSARNLHDPLLVDEIKRCLASSGAPSCLLQIEITESVLMEDHSAALDILANLKAMGIRLYIDDFGTGYSSLGYLATLPVHALKVDRSFVVGMGEKEEMATVVAAIISLGHNLGLEVVAEGVEDGEQLETLRALGCDEIQGYFFSKPLPAEDFRVWLRDFEIDSLAI